MKKISKEKVAQEIDGFKEIISAERLEALAQKHKAGDQRRRKLTLENFFWLVVMMQNQSLKLGGLGEATVLFSVASQYILAVAERITTMALSKQLQRRRWQFMRAVLFDLQARYPQQVPSLLRELSPQLNDWKLVDSTAIDVARVLRRRFASTNKGQAQIKLHIVYSAINHLPKCQKVTKQKCNDKKVNFVSGKKDQLYIFDLGYWCFPLLDQIIEIGSYFVSRLRGDCDPVIVSGQWQGQRLSEVLPKIKGNRLDMMVKLSKYRSNPMRNEVRLVGIKEDKQWKFYVTNLTGPEFSSVTIKNIYAVRWQIELFFNDLKHVLNLDKICSRNVTGIQNQIFAALIYYTLVRISMALAAKQTDIPVEHFSFRRSARVVKQVLNNSQFLIVKGQSWDFSQLLHNCVKLVILHGLKDNHYINNAVSMLPWAASA